MKRAAKKDSNNMEVEWEMDLEFERSTEQEAIRAHLEQLKKYFLLLLYFLLLIYIIYFK